MAVYVIGDIHGCHAALVQCLERCGFDNVGDTLVSLGDIVDGGPEPFECVEVLLKIKNHIAIRGNHDEWFLEFAESGYHAANWTYGGLATIKSYAKHAGITPIIRAAGTGYKTSLDPAHIPESHKIFFRNQELYYIDGLNNCFVHGGFNRFQPFAGQRRENYFWDRDLWMQALEWQLNRKLGDISERFEIVTEFRHIFLGHTSTMHWHVDKPMLAANIYNVDTGGSKGGKITIMDVETKKFWQSDLMDS